jgi:glycerophosphoryl diester phosphodiesterase
MFATTSWRPMASQWILGGSLTLIALFGSLPCASAESLPKPLVIAHRGASGELPEHTLEAYRRAIEQGADCIEPDLVMTRDGHLIARHEPMLDDTTDVAQRFPPERRRTRDVDGVLITAYFASDFTLEEIRTLRAIQPRPNRPHEHNGRFGIPTLTEIIELAQNASRELGRPVCIYPEIKHSTFHATTAGFGAYAFEDTLLRQLHAAYGNRSDAPVFIQSFEVSNLQYLRGRTKLRLVQLIMASDVDAEGQPQFAPPYGQPYDWTVAKDKRTYAHLLTPQGLDFVRTYANAIGVWKPLLLRTVADGIDRNRDGRIDARDRRIVGSTGVAEAAQDRGLLVHVWTMRDDSVGHGFSDPTEEMRAFFRLGVDGVFTDFPRTGIQARIGWR